MFLPVAWLPGKCTCLCLTLVGRLLLWAAFLYIRTKHERPCARARRLCKELTVVEDCVYNSTQQLLSAKKLLAVDSDLLRNGVVPRKESLASLWNLIHPWKQREQLFHSQFCSFLWPYMVQDREMAWTIKEGFSMVFWISWIEEEGVFKVPWLQRRGKQMPPILMVSSWLGVSVGKILNLS